MRCSYASVFSNGKEGKTSLEISYIFLPVVQILFSAELAGILMASNKEADKHTFKKCMS